MKSLAEARVKRVRAVELMSEGKSYDEIARAVGYSHRGSAHRAVWKALNEREADGVDYLRAMEESRLDALQAALWDRAMSGDHAATDAVISIIAERCKILGLYDHTPAWTAAGPTSMFIEDWPLLKETLERQHDPASFVREVRGETCK